MRRTAFTLIELIFVILLAGILAMAVTSLTRPDRLLNDTKFVLAKVMKTRYEAIGYDHRNFDGTFEAGDMGCLTLHRSSLEGNLSQAGAYRLRQSTQISVEGLGGNTICFDSLGRPHNGDFSLPSLLHREVDITIGDGKNRHMITIYPVSGYVTMKY